MVTDSKKLGIMMRGGSDFGLGIYITGVDQGSVAHNSGLKVSLFAVDKFAFLKRPCKTP